MRAILTVTIGVTGLLTALCGTVKAQAGPACTAKVNVWSWETYTPIGAYACVVAGVEGADNCLVNTASCPPVAAPSEDRCPCSSHFEGGSPINLATGNVYVKQTDVRLPGLGGGIELVRVWNSMWPSTQSTFQTGLFGPNWRSSFEERVFLGSDHYMKYARGDGSFWSFGGVGPEFDIAAPANAGATLLQGSSYWTLKFKNGEQRLFDNTSGNLIAIIDRNGNETQISYDAGGRLVSVADPSSRHLYFSYGSPTSFLVTSVTSDFGVSVSYSYDSQGRLLQVTEPDQSTLNFDYNGQSLIADVKDTNGKILESHTYDSSGRGLTSSRANGVDVVTVSYSNQ